MLATCTKLSKSYLKREGNNNKKRGAGEAEAGKKRSKRPKGMDPKEWRKEKVARDKIAAKKADVLFGFTTGLLLQLLSAPAVAENASTNLIRDIRAYAKDSYWYTETVGGSPQTSSLRTIFKKIIEKFKLEERSGFDGKDKKSGGRKVVVVECGVSKLSANVRRLFLDVLFGGGLFEGFYSSTCT